MSKSRNKPIIGITLGDPQGIGPEVIQRALSSPLIKKICRPIVFGDTKFFDFKNAQRLTPQQCGQLSAFYIEQAAQAARQGKIAGIVTAPISKERLQLAGYKYPGHTEFLAALTGTQKVRMMMAGPQLKVVLVTLHEAIKKISSLLTSSNIMETIEITEAALQGQFLIRRPKIAVAALNPHAGENGKSQRLRGNRCNAI